MFKLIIILLVDFQRLTKLLTETIINHLGLNVSSYTLRQAK